MSGPGQYDYRNGTLWPFVGTRDPLARQQLFTCPADPEPRVWINDLSSGSGRNFSYNFNQEMSNSLTLGNYANGYGIGVHLSRVKGSEHKILVVEEKAPTFAACFDAYLFMISDPTYWQSSSGPSSPFSGRHDHCANMGMADGHVELLGPNDLPGAVTDLPATAKGMTPTQALANPPVKYNYYFTLPHF